MRLKSFTAPSMAEAMRMIRDELGDDAIIVSTQRAIGGKGVRITAALEQSDPDEPADLFGNGEAPVAQAVRAALVEHGTPPRLLERLVNAAHTSEIDDPLRACTAAMDAGFAYAPLPEVAAPRPFMLVGPPGAGKTIAVAKLAARTVLNGRRVAVITADHHRAGAVHQLAAFTRILGVDLKSARGPDSLRQAVDGLDGRTDLVFIDSPGLNPFKPTDMEFLAGLVEAADVEPILALAAGGDAEEAAEIGEAFGEAGATRLLATRLDTTRRFGAIMAAADAAQLMLCDVSASPHVASGLSPLSPQAMARLILPNNRDEAQNDLLPTEATT